MSLKKLKYLFGQRPRIAQAVLAKVINEKMIQNDDVKGLSELSYSINDCLVTLKQLNYMSDLYSSDTLRQAVRRLPPNMLKRWAEHSLVVRQQDEPNLTHLDIWLQKRVLALKEAYLPDGRQGQGEKKLTYTVIKKDKKCQLCDDHHQFWKCSKYTEFSPQKKFEFVKSLKKCFNCFKDGHITNKCTSKKHLFQA